LHLHPNIFTGEDMTKDQIFKMAKQSGLINKDYDASFLNKFTYAVENFAKLVAQHEREQNAKLCEKHGKAWEEKMLLGFQATLNDAAEAIRSREIMDDKEHKVGEYIPMPKQEPVGWAEHGVINWLADKQFNHTSFLYDTPADQKWVGLSDDEISEIRLKTFDIVATNHEVYKAIEAKLKEKNT